MISRPSRMPTCIMKMSESLGLWDYGKMMKQSQHESSWCIRDLASHSWSSHMLKADLCTGWSTSCPHVAEIHFWRCIFLWKLFSYQRWEMSNIERSDRSPLFLVQLPTHSHHPHKWGESNSSHETFTHNTGYLLYDVLSVLSSLAQNSKWNICLS